MKAVLVGKLGPNKLYYIIDAKVGQDDAIVEEPDGTTRNANFMTLISSTTGIQKMMNSPFHKMLWNGPHSNNVKNWRKVFIEKTDEPDENMLNGAVVQTSIGSARKKKVETEAKVKNFIAQAKVNKAFGADFSSKMIMSREIPK